MKYIPEKNNDRLPNSPGDDDYFKRRLAEIDKSIKAEGTVEENPNHRMTQIFEKSTISKIQHFLSKNDQNS